MEPELARLHTKLTELLALLAGDTQYDEKEVRLGRH
jgi:hypothetical protein